MYLGLQQVSHWFGFILGWEGLLRVVGGWDGGRVCFIFGWE